MFGGINTHSTLSLPYIYYELLLQLVVLPIYQGYSFGQAFWSLNQSINCIFREPYLGYSTLQNTLIIQDLCHYQYKTLQTLENIPQFVLVSHVYPEVALNTVKTKLHGHLHYPVGYYSHTD